jgi:hypothetical protein
VVAGRLFLDCRLGLGYWLAGEVREEGGEGPLFAHRGQVPGLEVAGQLTAMSQKRL